MRAEAHHQATRDVTCGHLVGSNITANIVVVNESWNQRCKQILLPLGDFASTICNHEQLMLGLTWRMLNIILCEAACHRLKYLGV
jgi:hypothetical protein